MAAAMAEAVPGLLPSETSSRDFLVNPSLPQVKSKVAAYTINRDKAVNRLAFAAASNMEDFNIDVKDSSGNVNSKCSPAFYAAVAKPSLEALPSDWSSDPVAGCVASTSTGPTVLQDNTSLNQNTQLKIHISTNSPTPTLLGSVCIHLHNTTCLVQIQGAKRAPDHSSLAVWAVQNIILPLWSKHSCEIRYGPEVVEFIHRSIIAAFAGAPKGPVSSAAAIKTYSGPPTCGHCKKTIAKNLTPVLCAKQGCGKFFHKVDQPLHICTPLPRSPSAALLKNQHAQQSRSLDPPNYREVPPEIDIDSEVDSDDESSSRSPPSPTFQPVNTVSIRPSNLTTPVPLPPTGQQLLQEAVVSLQSLQSQEQLPALQYQSTAPEETVSPNQTSFTGQGPPQQSLSLQQPLAPVQSQASQQSVRPRNNRANPQHPS